MHGLSIQDRRVDRSILVRRNAQRPENRRLALRRDVLQIALEVEI